MAHRHQALCSSSQHVGIKKAERRTNLTKGKNDEGDAEQFALTYYATNINDWKDESPFQRTLE